MALVRFDDKPKITDTILLEIETPDVDGCFVDDPYRVDQVVVYFVERDFLGTNWGQYDTYQESQELVDKFLDAQKKWCDDPSEDNTTKYKKALHELESSRVTTTIYFKERVPIEVFGTVSYPAWLSTDLENSIFTKVETDENGDPAIGRFSYEWNPQGAIREGDYFLCWTWSPLTTGEKLSAHHHFKIVGDNKAVTALPIHQTPEGKYETLLEKYLPEMYKTTIADGDLTPEVTDKFNKSLADEFTFIENLANQVIDLLDANVVHESILSYLSNLFNLRLKSNDPTLWRRQIKESVPLFKKKGTLQGLKEAFAQAGMKLNEYTQYWQIVSKYTWQESFPVTTSATFLLEKSNIILPIDEDNFGLWIRRSGSDEYTAVDKECVNFEIVNCGLQMTWVGDDLPLPVSLYTGDIVRVLYQYESIPDLTEQSRENYLRQLPLQDTRDETEQNYPPKNWNVRLIERDDPLFDSLVSVRHPFHDDILFGHIRTEFAYSENIYNMEEYNGSSRPSFEPCHIDKSFRDPCGSCISSTYSVNVGIEDLSNDRMLEAQDILQEMMPFHAKLHSIAFQGEFNEFLAPPTEVIDFIITFDHSENVLSGQANPFFHRIMEGGLAEWVINREDLADKITVNSGKLGTAYNEGIYIIAPSIIFNDLGVGANILKIFGPSANSGEYQIREWNGHIAKVSTVVSEPLDESQFTFQLSNIIYSNSVTSIDQDDWFGFSDEEIVFENLGVKTLWDIENTPDYTGGCWKLLIPGYSATPFEIEDIVNGKLILVNNGSLPTTNDSGLSFSLLNDTDDLIVSGTLGELEVKRRGYVNLHDTAIIDIQDMARIGYYLFYENQEYRIMEFDDHNFWIEGYVGGNVGGANVQTRKRLVESGIGQFGYSGLKLVTLFDHESEFGVVNGSNPPLVVTDDSKFKENFMFKIGDDFYRISNWDGTNVKLAGRSQNWGVVTGTTVSYSLVHFPTEEVSVKVTVFDHLDRDGKDVAIREIYSDLDESVMLAALSMNPGSGVQENMSQDENVYFTIETKDGSTKQGEV